MKSVWVCLSSEQENTGYLKTWIRVSELNGISGDKPVPGREAGRQGVTWQDCHRPLVRQAQCRSRLWAGLPPLTRACFPFCGNRLVRSPRCLLLLLLHLMPYLFILGLLLVFCSWVTERKSCHFCTMDEPQQYYDIWKSTVWLHVDVKSKTNVKVKCQRENRTIVSRGLG